MWMWSKNLARDRACAAVRRGARQRAAPFRRAGQHWRSISRLLQPGDTVLGMNLSHGGHLTHGSPVNLSGKYYQLRALRRGSERPSCIDYDEVRASGTGAQAQADRRRRVAPIRARIDFASASGRSPTRWARCLMVDMAHIAGLVAAGVHPEPRALCRCGDHHHPQDPARPARRHDPLQGGICQGRSTRPSSPARRAAR